MSCSCPTCPLVAKQTQACNVIVTLIAKRGSVYVRNCAEGTEKPYADLVVTTLTQLKEQKKVIRVGTSVTFVGHDCEYTIDRIKNNQFKVCFHTKVLDEDPV
jgi:tRNA A37 threonylcarbamoyladenosine modification protein TsaB